MLLRRITIGLMLCALLASAPGIRSTPAMAHPGGTASDGCHYCRTNCSSWGDPYGVRHCHGGGSPTTSPTPTAPPPPPPPPPIDREFARQQVSRLYLAYFLRYADDAGREYWVGRMVAGLTLIQMSDEFARSPEFGTLYGSLDNAFFVDLVYDNVLGRAPDVAGHTYWTTALNGGAATRGKVMVGFSESTEFKERIYRGQVRRLYLAYLSREPDSDYWVQRMLARMTLIQVSDEFAKSPEFGTLYGSLDNAFFVDLVYRNVLGRAPDVAGHTYWTTALNDRTLSRGAVMLGFSESIEFITRVG